MISTIQTIQGNSGASFVNTLAIVLGSNVIAGDFLSLIIVTSNPSLTAVASVTDTQGNTWVKQNSYIGVGNVSLDFWYVQNALPATTPTVTITLAAAQFNTISAIGKEYRGILQQAPNPFSAQVDATVEVQESSFISSHPCGPSGVPIQNNELVIAAYGYTNAGITLTETSGGYTAVVNQSNSTQFTGLAYTDKIIENPAAQSVTFDSGVTATEGVVFLTTIKGQNYVPIGNRLRPAIFKPG